jgi:hypothetical protein
MSLYLNKKPKYIIYTIENYEEDEDEDIDGIYDENDLLEDQIKEINKKNKIRKMLRDKRLQQINSEIQGQLQQDEKLQLLNQLQHQQNIQMLRTYQQRTNTML